MSLSLLPPEKTLMIDLISPLVAILNMFYFSFCSQNRLEYEKRVRAQAKVMAAGENMAQ